MSQSSAYLMFAWVLAAPLFLVPTPVFHYPSLQVKRSTSLIKSLICADRVSGIRNKRSNCQAAIKKAESNNPQTNIITYENNRK